jgi:hypothetical protein
MLIAGNGLVDVFTAAATEFGLVGGTEFVLGHGPIFCESFASVGGECVLVAVNGLVDVLTAAASEFFTVCGAEVVLVMA